MKKRYWALTLSLVVALTMVGCYKIMVIGPTDSWEDVVEYMRPSVVKVIVGDIDPDTDLPFAIGTGTGFIISERGHIVTAAHVAKDRVKYKPWIKVQFYDGTEKIVKWKRMDDRRDIAVLKVSGDYMTPLAFASEEPREGQPVLVMGCNGVSDWAVTDGIVSKAEMFYDKHLGHGWLQTTASINPGYSGGPIVNADGEIVGMSVAYMTKQNDVYLFARGSVIEKTVKKLLGKK